MNQADQRAWKARVHEIIFEANTPAGKTFDILLIVCILSSVVAVMLDSVAGIRQVHGPTLDAVEWFFTLLFTVEYLLRLWCIGRPIKYATSFFGIVDLLAILPTYLSVLIPQGEVLIVVRLFRILRVFRVLKIVRYLGEAEMLAQALRASRRKITVFLFAVVTLATIIGAVMYVVEGEEAGYTSIPKGVYWAIVTLTTVGYGDISPITPLGQFLAAIVMIMGYGVIAVPAGIVTVEMSYAKQRRSVLRSCPECSAESHDADAVYCKICGSQL